MRLISTLAALVAALAAGAAFAAGNGSAQGASTDLSGFSGPLPQGTHLAVGSVYREGTTHTTFRLRQVRCFHGAPGATCFTP